MKKLFLATALATTALGTTAHAQDQGPYITAEGGGVKNERQDAYGPNGQSGYQRSKIGWTAGGIVGYDFGHFRLEAEGNYSRDRQKSEHVYGVGFGDNANGFHGYVTTIDAMGNVLIGVGHWGSVKAYAGGGAGWARVRIHTSDGV